MNRKTLTLSLALFLGMLLVVVPCSYALEFNTHASIVETGIPLGTLEDSDGPATSGTITSEVLSPTFIGGWGTTYYYLDTLDWMGDPGYSRASANEDGHTAVAVEGFSASDGDWELYAEAHTTKIVNITDPLAYEEVGDVHWIIGLLVP